MTSYEPQKQGSRWAYPPAGSPAAAPYGQRRASAPAADAPAASHYPPASAYPSPSSIYQPRFPADSGTRPPRKDNNVRNIVLGIVATLLAAGVAIVVAIRAQPGSDGMTSKTDAAFITAIHTGIPRTVKTPNSEILKVSRIICGALAAEPDPRIVGQTLVGAGYGYTSYEAGFFMGASIKAYCPKYSYLIPSHR
jgi:hypothetical protein